MDRGNAAMLQCRAAQCFTCQGSRGDFQGFFFTMAPSRPDSSVATHSSNAQSLSGRPGLLHRLATTQCISKTKSDGNMWTKIQEKNNLRIYVSTNYKLNLLHGATLAGVDSGFSTFCLSWESQGLRAWASPSESLRPIPTRSPKSTYIYLSHSPNDCHSPTASEKQEQTLRRERENGLKKFEAFFCHFGPLIRTFDSDPWYPCFICEGFAEEISGSCDITRAALKRCNGSMCHDRVTDLRAASLRPLRRGVGVRRCWLGTCGIRLHTI